MTEDNELCLEVSSNPRLLAVVRGVVGRWMEVLKVGGNRRDEVVLAVDEACANCMRHAYRGRTDEPIHVRLSADDEWVEISVSDRGVPCPADQAAYRPMSPPAPDSIEPGGLGVKLIYRVFDEVRFCPGADRGNCVTMRLRRTTDSEDNREDRD